MTNSVDPDQTAPSWVVWPGSTLFAQACLSEYLGSLGYASEMLGSLQTHINGPSHEIMALFVLRKLILQTRMRSHPVGLDVWFLAHLSRRLTRWAYRIGLEPASVCPCVCACVCPLTISNMNISKTRGPIATKFYLKHHWGGGKPALGFGPGRIRTLVSMATDSSHRVIMGKTASPRFLGCFWSDPFHTCR